MLEAIQRLVQNELKIKKVCSLIEQDTSKFEIENICSDEFSHGIVKIQSLLNTVYLDRDTPVMVTKSSKNKGENTKVFYLKDTLS